MAHRPSLKRVTANAEKLNDVIKLVKDGIISLYGASKLTGYSRNRVYRHFQRYINKEKRSKVHKNKSHQRVFTEDEVSVQVFTEDEEHQLLNNIKDYISTHKVFSSETVQELAYHFAKQKNKKYPLSWDEHKMASVSWLRRFCKRYNEHILLRNPEACTRTVDPPEVIPPRVTPPSTPATTPLPTSPLTISPATPVTTFQSFKAALDECPLDLPPINIWNIDEITLYNPPEILTKEMQSFSTVSSENNNLTIISAMNAGGDTIPPMIIFPYVDYNDFVLDGAPPETIGAMNSSGGSSEDLFLEFFRHFLRYAKPSKDLPCIVLLDNHESHMCLPVHQLAKEKGVILITFQPHENHKVQPIDEGVSKAFQSYYNNAARELLSTPDYVGRKLYTSDIATLVGKAFPMAFTQTNIMQGFRVTGFYPLNENRRPDFKPLPSDVTDHLAAIDRDSSASSQDIDDPLSPSPSYLSSSQSTSSSSVIKEMIRFRQGDLRESSHRIRNKLAETGETIIEISHKSVKSKETVLHVKSKSVHKQIPSVRRKVYTISDSSDESVNFCSSDSEV